MTFIRLTGRLLWNTDSIVALTYTPEQPAADEKDRKDDDLRLYVEEAAQEQYKALAIFGISAKTAWATLQANVPPQLTAIHSRLWVNLEHATCVELVDRTEEINGEQVHHDWIEVLMRDHQRISLEAELSDISWEETQKRVAGQQKRPGFGIGS